MVFSEYMPSCRIAESHGSFIPHFFKGISILFSIWLYQFTFPPTVQKFSLFSTSASPFIVCKFFDDGHSDQCEVIPHCNFDLHVSNNE